MEDNKVFLRKQSMLEYVMKIKSYVIQDFARYCLDRVPDYFWTTAASSTGKYHPKFALGDGGLFRHTRTALYYANEMLKLEMFHSLDEYSDLIYFSLIFHDCQKLGKDSKFTLHQHPLLAVQFIKDRAKEYEQLHQGFKNYEHQMNLIYDLIASHMGQWNTNDYVNIVLPKPKTHLEKFVHLCDYLASRKGDKECLDYQQQ